VAALVVVTAHTSPGLMSGEVGAKLWQG